MTDAHPQVPATCTGLGIVDSVSDREEYAMV